jgi:hypothetical protein
MYMGSWRNVAAMMLVMVASFAVTNAEEAVDSAEESRVIAVVLGEEIPTGWEARLIEVIWPRIYDNFVKEKEEAGAFEIRDMKARNHYWSQYPEHPPGPESLIKEGEAAKEEINKRWWEEEVAEKVGMEKEGPARP